MSLTIEKEIKTKLQQALAGRTKKVIRDANRRASAVLIPLFFTSGQYSILFTRRTQLVHHHKGEISFPGGGFQPGDDDLKHTALRESQEEIGLDPNDVQVLGELDDIITRGSPYIVSPFVGTFPCGYKYTTSAFEIAEIITVPVPLLLKKECRQESPEIAPDGEPITAYTYTCGPQQIVGATARILKQFLDIYSTLFS